MGGDAKAATTGALLFDANDPWEVCRATGGLGPYPLGKPDVTGEV